jgi:UDP-glucuronate 4-epimerase
MDKCRQGKHQLLITGAAGFIGFHAALKFANQFDVVGVDNFNAYYPVSLKLARANVLHEHGIHVLRADITDFALLSELFQLCTFTHVLHLAAQAGVRYALRDPFSYIRSNIQGTVTLLEVMKINHPIPILVYASSSSVYGNSQIIPFSEFDRADSPASLYAATKRSQELITKTYCSIFGMSATGLRFFTVYGPWGRPDMAIMSFTRKLLKNETLLIFIGPENKSLSRDFTYIDDIVDGIQASVFTASHSQPYQHRIFNLGNSKVVDVAYMVRILERLTGKKARSRFVPRSVSGEVLLTKADISLASIQLGYSPSTNIEDGLARFYSWYQDFFLFKGVNVKTEMSKYVPD